MAATPNRRLLAVAEAVLSERASPTVNIYDTSTLRRRKVLNWPEIGSTTIAAVSFSRDGRLCLTQGGAPEWKLVLWNVEKVTDHARANESVHSRFVRDLNDSSTELGLRRYSTSCVILKRVSSKESGLRDLDSY